MDDKNRGLYPKFCKIERVDEVSQYRHRFCEYFVLDWNCDPFTIPAMEAYATACEAEYPVLAADIRKKVKEYQKHSTF